MRNCEQTKGQSVLEHGQCVEKYLFDLINHLRFDSPLKYEWRLPDWVLENKELILASLPEDKTLSLYTVYHDCAKPYCLKIDAEGKRHFPNHSEISYKVFLQHFNNNEAAELIRRDMDIHLLKSDGIDEFSSSPYAITLLITGLSEIHANCKMFGGMDSTSFKIKWKAITSRGKQIIKIKSYENK